MEGGRWEGGEAIAVSKYTLPMYLVRFLAYVCLATSLFRICSRSVRVVELDGERLVVYKDSENLRLLAIVSAAQDGEERSSPNTESGVRFPTTRW